MQKNSLKRLLFLLSLVVLVVALMAPAVMAQDGQGTADETHAETTGEVVGEAPAEEGGAGIAALGINAGFLLAQIVNFLIIAVALTLLLWRPAVNMLDARSAKIEKGLEDAAAAARARQNAEAEAEKVMQEARAKVAAEIEAARSRGEEVAKAIESEARTDAEKIRKDAQNDAATARNAELAGMRDQVLNISVAVAQRILGESIDAKKQKQLVDKFFTDLPADAKSLSGSVEVVSAMPLTDAEQKQVEKELKAGSIEFVVDPSILGGLIVRSGDRVVDGSVRSNLNSLAARLS